MKQVIQSYNNIFYNHIKSYDLGNNNLLRKMIHSYEVARNCFEIASRNGMNVKERNFCYLMGLFHDIGRFKQWKIYQTYDDAKSVDHGELSYDIFGKEFVDRHFDYNFWKWNDDKSKCQKDIFTKQEKEQIFILMKNEWSVK